MPYPILKLPYALQKRLRSLATPKETYNLQISLGFEKNYLGPLQKCKHSRHCLRVTQENGKNVFSFNVLPINIEVDTLLIANKRFILYDSQSVDFYTDNTFYDNFINNCTHLHFGCRHKVGTDLLHHLSTKWNFDCIKWLQIFSSEASLQVILRLFKNIRGVVTTGDYAYKHWLKDALISEKCNMVHLEINGSFENLFSFTPTELKNFFDRQLSEFHLLLTCDNPPEGAADLIRQKIGSHFEEVTNDNGYTGGVLVVGLGKRVYRKIMGFKVGPVTRCRVKYML